MLIIPRTKTTRIDFTKVIYFKSLFDLILKFLLSWLLNKEKLIVKLVLFVQDLRSNQIPSNLLAWDCLISKIRPNTKHYAYQKNMGRIC